MLTLLAACAAAAQSVAPQAPAVAAPKAEASVRAFQAARFAGMHMAATLLYRHIKPAAANGTEVREQQHEAEGLAYWAGAIPGMFPAGSLGGDSRALPAIEANRADFLQKARDLRLAATRLAELAEAGDRAGFAAQANVVEAACRACHTAYRAPDAPPGH
jgi:cytochrome c556